MTTRTGWLLALALSLFVTPWARGAAPIDTRCLAEGGVAQCTEPTLVADPVNAPVDADMWTYSVCDFAGTFAWREAAWTKVLGGKPLFDPAIVSVSSAFEQNIHSACQIGVTDSGWGYTIPSNILCWTGGSLVKNQKPYREFRRLDFSGLSPGANGCSVPWTETVFAARGRKLACPKTYGTRTKANGDVECWKLPPECSRRAKVANPITLLDGCKNQREPDYRSRTAGAVEVERFYNGGGYFRFDVAPENASDVWRTTWDRRIVVPPVAGAVLAYAQRAEGSVQAFASSGREMQNNEGGGSALLQRLTDSAGAASGWRLTTAEMDIETYDASGRLMAVALRNGRSYALTYANGRLATVADTFGNAIAFSYDPSGRLRGFVAPGNRVYTYGYDPAGRLTSVTYPDNAVRTYHYEDPNFVHALTGITDENGARYATWSYDGAGRATLSQHAGGVDSVTLYYRSYSPTANEGTTSVVDGFGTARTYNYHVAGGVVRIRSVTDSAGTSISTFDANGNTATLRDANGVQTTYAFDLARNLEVSRTEAVGTTIARTITTQWHPVYRLPMKIVAPSSVPGVNEVTDYAYDARGNLLRKTLTTGASSRQWTMTYSALGQLLTVDGARTDQADVASHAYYDVNDPCIGCRGNLKTTTNALAHVTTFDGYDVDGQPTRVIDPNGVVTAMTYDIRGRLRTRTANAGSPLAETMNFDYDAAGQLVKTTMPDGSFVRYQYDAAHRLTEIVDSLGTLTQYTLDAMGNRIKEDTYDPSDRLQRTRQRVYDALNRLYTDIDASGRKSTYSYDSNGNLKTSVDPMGRSTAMNYDGVNRLTSSTDPAGGIVRYGYDPRDRLASVQDPNNLSTAYTRDGLGNLVRLASPDSGITTYVPDSAGNTIGSTDARGLSTAYAHDALNRQTLATFPDGSVAWEYDNATVGGAFAKGRLTKVTDPSGTTTYLYDALGRVLRKTQTVGTGAATKSFVLGYQYAAGRMTSVTYPSGRKLIYAFDAQGHVTAISMAGKAVPGGGAVLSGSAVLSAAAYAPFGPVHSWSWSNGQTYRRTYDLDGRIATLTTGPDSTAFGNGSWMFGYDSLDRLATAALPTGEAFAYSYDANGNRKQETRAGVVTNYSYFPSSNRLQSLAGAAAKTFAYDAAGNLTANADAAFTYDGRGRLTQTGNGYRYAINGLGQRVSKSGPAGTTYFAYDEQGHLVGEYDASGIVRQELVYLGDTPVASLRPSAAGNVDIYAIYTDHLDTPRLITDLGNRTVWEWPLDTFGAGAANENPSGLGTFSFNLRFPGQYYDAETGLHYNYFRDYDPSVGRYVESDPIGLLGGHNLYLYTNSPALEIDPFGMMGRAPGSGKSGPIRGLPRGPRFPGSSCGPEGVPNNFPSDYDYFSFERACVAHDRCYEVCGAIRAQCDEEFLEAMQAECLQIPPASGGGFTRTSCNRLASYYYWGVRLGGNGPFDEAQQQCKGCK